MSLLLVLLSSLAVSSAQSCSCETSPTQFTDQYFNCPIDNFCSDSLVSGSCGYVCHPSGSFHSMPYDDADASNTYGSLNCAGSLFDSDNYGALLCAYSAPSNVLCESGVLQYTYSDNTTDEYNYRLYLNKNTCVISGGYDGSKTITSVSCKAKVDEISSCLSHSGASSGVTGHCHFGTCWLYCQDNMKQLSFQKYGTGPRIDVDFLPCEANSVLYGQTYASNLECN